MDDLMIRVAICRSSEDDIDLDVLCRCLSLMTSVLTAGIAAMRGTAGFPLKGSSLDDVDTVYPVCGLECECGGENPVLCILFPSRRRL